ncbi:MAG: lipopolysaccharide biosynthesis protein [Oscillospiraceae bacterium]|nr:lipopolysaccharide biosynthesis protein [Oscillospiraceae bacterium]
MANLEGNQNVNIILKNEEKGQNEVIVSLSGVFKKIRKYFIAWLLTAVIIGGIIVGASIFSTTSATTPVRTLVSFTYPGIEKGKNPDGSDFDPYSLIQASVIEKALRDCEEDPQLLETIRRDIVIDSIIPEDTVERLTTYKKIFDTNSSTSQINAAQQMLAENWFSTQYTVTFNYKKSGLTRQNAVKLLNTIMDRYRDYFFEQYGYNEALGSALASQDYTEYDYAEAVDMFRTSLNTLNRYVNSLSNDDTTRFRSAVTGYTFADLKSAIGTVMDLDLDLISSYLNVYNITKDKDRLQAYYEYRIENLEREKKKNEEKLTTIQESLDSYEKDQIIIFSDSTTNTESSIASEEYDNLINRKITAQSDLSETTQYIEYYKQRLTALKRTTVGSTDKVKKIESDLAKLNEKVNQLIQLVNDTADDYYQNVSLSNAFNVLVPATSDVATNVKSGITKAVIPTAGTEILLLVAFLALSFIEAIVVETRRKQMELETAAAETDADSETEKTEPTEDTKEDQNKKKSSKK